jgi:hypothetical protein
VSLEHLAAHGHIMRDRVASGARIVQAATSSLRTSGLFTLCRLRPSSNSASTNRGMTRLRASANGGGVVRSARSSAMAAFESKASRSNFNLIPSERIADGARELAPFLFAE